MLTLCTTPLAPFYQVDLAILALFEGNGLDLPCGAVSALTGAALLGLVTFAALATLGAFVAARGAIRGAF